VCAIQVGRVPHAFGLRLTARQLLLGALPRFSGERDVAHHRVLRHDGPHTGDRSMRQGRDAAMATDYDEPRHNESDAVVEDSLEVLKERHRKAQSPVVDVEETDTAEGFELPGADLSGEELSVRVVPKQADEFTCSACFLVHHRHRYAGERAGP
jgi:hypothetical protein